MAWAMLVVASAAPLGACGGAPGQRADAGADTADTMTGDAPTEETLSLSALRINELLADDVDGTTIDEDGQLEDWIELVNVGAVTVPLGGYTIANNDGLPQALPPFNLGPGETLILYADDDQQQGDRHLRFKLEAAGERVVLRDPTARIIDDVTFPALGANQSYARFPDGGAWRVCRYASPGRRNGERCGPPVAPELPDDQHFPPYTWPADPGPPKPLAITELALYPARFVEVKNTSPAPVALADFALRVAPFSPVTPFPVSTEGSPLAWPQATPTLAPGQRLVVTVPADAAGLPDPTGEREGAVTLFRADGTAVDRVDFIRWPNDAVLSRGADDGALLQFCTNATPGTAAPCSALASRAVGDRLHHLYTPGDFEALSAGSTELESRSVKFIIDMNNGDVVHFLGTKAWALHYTFVRERIYKESKLDRCDPQQAAVFQQGWVDFSVREYFQINRRFLLGTAVYWGGSGLSTIEFAQGDVITGEQMRRALFTVAAHLPNPRAWSIRPTANDQAMRLHEVEGTVPIVDKNAPFRGRTFQPLVAAPAYGLLKFVTGAELGDAVLGPGVILLTDEVPNDIPLVGGLITEAFQTPLAHVAVLAKNRGTPDMALTGARQDPRIAPFLDKLVRLEVTGGGFTIREATADEVREFLEKKFPAGELRRPRLDTTVRGPVDLAGRSLDDLPTIGAKAAQLAELIMLSTTQTVCTNHQGLPVPDKAFALPLVHEREHFAVSGAAATLAAWQARADFAADTRVRAMGLAEVRAKITAHPVEPSLLQEVSRQIAERFGGTRVRLRSSSNTEDLPGFNGAGLYISLSVAVGDPERRIDDGLRAVWASLWTPRAYDERELGRVDHASTAMGVLIHSAFQTERANGVAISRNVLDPIYGDAYYWNAQAGEASVTNPAPGVTSEQGLYDWFNPLTPLNYQSRSSFTSGTVTSPAELDALMCALSAIHGHFKFRLDPLNKNRWFATDIEWKLLGPERKLLIKQARPYSFGSAEIPPDCREF